MLAIKDLTLYRGDRALFHELNASIKPGEIVAVLGPNGAGKSTLLLSILHLHQISSGCVMINKQPVEEFSKQKLAKLITWQGDLPPAEFGLTVKQRLLLSSDGGKNDEILAALQYMQLEPLKDRALGNLSSGERQRVEIASTMVRDNPIWLMDEPTAHLDMKHQVDCLQLMRREASQGRLIITVLHDLQQAAAVADVVILLDGKGGIEVGPARDMLTALQLEPVFGVKLQGSGRNLMPDYSSSF